MDENEATRAQLLAELARLRDAAARGARVEAELQNSVRRYRAVVDHIVDGVITIDQDGLIESFNLAAERIFGYRADEVIGRNVRCLMPAPYRHEHDAYLQHYHQTGIKKIIGIGREVVGRRKDGTTFPMDLAVSQVELGDRRTFTGIVRDITQRKQDEERAARFGRLLDSSSNEIYLFNAQSLQVVQANRGARENLDYSIDELRDLTFLDFNPDLDTVSLDKLLQPLLQGGRRDIRIRSVHQRRDGSCYPVEIHLQLTSYDGAPVFMAIGLDITERKQLEDQLLQAQKMESIGLLAGGVAHDFNNQLGIILFDVDMLMEGVEAGPELREDLLKIRRVVMRAADLTRQLLVFSRRQPMQPRALDLNVQITEVEKMLARLLGDHVRVERDLAPDLQLIRADPGNIDQVIVNLALNARDAMPEGGLLRLETTNVEISSGYCRRHSAARPGRFVRLRVSDTGSGMSGETKRRLFEPFFTTKEMGKGTGLGLAVVYGIVQAHNGWIVVESQQETGSHFEILLPALEEENWVLPAAPVDAPQPQGQGERILLVEDELDLQQRTTRVLERNGYRVRACTTVAQARAVFADEDFELVLSDIALPDGKGSDLVVELRARRPATSVLLVSGYAGENVDWQNLEGEELALLQKPFSIADLLLKISEVLRRRG